VFEPALSAEIELRIPSVKKSFDVLGFKAEVDIDEGIRNTAKWVEKNLL
jgi:UDP-glucose 4-epimerase